MPRLFASQPLNCSPIDASFQAGVDTPVPREIRKTRAEGTSIAHPLRLREIIAALKESGGATVAVIEAEIVTALRKLAQAGIFTEPTCASAAPPSTIDRRRQDQGRRSYDGHHIGYRNEGRGGRRRSGSIGHSLSVSTSFD
jgi:threonine synthase